MRKLNKNNGITLISLVITIIVMLILVGVSITLAVNGGLFEYAGNAVGDTRNAMENEQGLIDDMIENYIKPNTETFSEIYEKNTTITQGDYTVTIPAGFAVGISDGINKIEEGLVIQDAKGNQFVWVPCTTDESKLNKIAVKYTQDIQYDIEAYYNDIEWEDEGENKNSVIKYGGFYVGRYEAGIPSNAPFYSNTNGATYTYRGRDTTDYVPVSKKNTPVWNRISQTNAKTVSANMYKDNSSVESSLIDNYAWDTIVNWMESKEKYKGISTDSTKYGNYVNVDLNLTDVLYAKHYINFKSWTESRAETYTRSNINVSAREPIKDETINVDLYELATGSLENTKILNIYDMAGNVWEWTTGTGLYNGTRYAVHRGGGFERQGFDYTITKRYGRGKITDFGITCGFRVVLYVK